MFPKFLPMIVGDRRAREILLLNEEIPARKAQEWGLVNYVVPREELDRKVDDLVEKLIQKFPTPVTRDDLKAEPTLADMMLLQRGSRLSIQPVTAAEWKAIHKLAGMKDR